MDCRAPERENLKEVFDVANQHLKDWIGIEGEMSDPLVKRAVADHSESIRRIKVKTRSILEKDMREVISRSTADRWGHRPRHPFRPLPSPVA